MEAELVRELPAGEGWQYEPKWDGFRGVLENDGGELALWSRNGRPLLRYFPELAALGELLPPHSALDGEIVIAREGVLDFDSMQTRLHPAESRVRKLSAEIPAIFIAFDLLLWDGEPIHERPLEARREELLRRGEGFWISPATSSLDAATAWLDRFEATGLDGVIAKRHDEILALVKPLLKDAPERRFSEPNRWGGGELEQSPVRPELVAEVRYDKVQGNRFRHGSRLLRFRDDKDPKDCTWREVRPPRRRGDPTFESLLA